jgi:hypothetical protein
MKTISLYIDIVTIGAYHLTEITIAIPCPRTLILKDSLIVRCILEIIKVY